MALAADWGSTGGPIRWGSALRNADYGADLKIGKMCIRDRYQRANRRAMGMGDRRRWNVPGSQRGIRWRAVEPGCLLCQRRSLYAACIQHHLGRRRHLHLSGAGNHDRVRQAGHGNLAQNRRGRRVAPRKERIIVRAAGCGPYSRCLLYTSRCV